MYVMNRYTIRTLWPWLIVDGQKERNGRRHELSRGNHECFKACRLVAQRHQSWRLTVRRASSAAPYRSARTPHPVPSLIYGTRLILISGAGFYGIESPAPGHNSNSQRPSYVKSLGEDTGHAREVFGTMSHVFPRVEKQRVLPHFTHEYASTYAW